VRQVGQELLERAQRVPVQRIGLRLRDPLLAVDALEALEVLEPPPAKSEDNLRSSVLIWFLIERASVSFDRDKSMGS